jgi:uncharacterized lipoprotein YbaY
MIVLTLNVFMIVVTARAMEVLSQNTQREIGQRPVSFLRLKMHSSSVQKDRRLGLSG